MDITMLYVILFLQIMLFFFCQYQIKRAKKKNKKKNNKQKVGNKCLLEI